MTKTDIVVPHQTTTQLFVTRTSCLKYQNSISSPKNRIRQKKLFNTIKIYHVLFCLVLCCSILYCSIEYLLFFKPNALENNKSKKFIFSKENLKLQHKTP